MKNRPKDLKELYSQLSKQIKEKGYEIGQGSLRDSYFTNNFKEIGILDPKKTAIVDEIFYFYDIRFPRELGRERIMYVGSLWLDNKARKAKFDSSWVLEVYGRENLERMHSLAEDLIKCYDLIFARVKLIVKEPAYESFADDVPPLFG